MRSLREIQMRFRESIVDPHALDLADAFNCPPSRMQIYRNNIFSTLEETLKNTYPTVERLVGSDFFKTITSAYIDKYPACSLDLAQYGAHFSAFLDTLRHTQGIPYLPEIAQLDWAYQEVFFEKESSTLDLNALKQVPEAQYSSLKLQLLDASRLFAFKHPVLKIWQRCHQPQSCDDILVLSEMGDYVLVYRSHWHVCFEKLSVGEYAFLLAFQSGSTFEIAALTVTDAEPCLDLAMCFEKHTRLGTFTAFFL